MAVNYRVEIIDNGHAIALFDMEQRLRFHAIWLRDNAMDSESRDAANGQRLISVIDLAGDTLISDAHIDSDDHLQLTFQPDNKALGFPLPWLLDHCYDQQEQREEGWLPADVQLWDGERELPTADYHEVSSNPDALRHWLRDIRRFGFARLCNVPTSEGTVCQIAELFGYVRETNYGRFFDVRAEVDPSNLAYTGLGLLAHTDNPYRDPVPTLQLVACMENSADGGDSFVVDGFAAAKELQSVNPDMFRILASYCARFEFSGSDDVELRARRPLLELAPDGELQCFRFNNRSIAPIVDVPFAVLPAYYAAYRQLAEIIESEKLRLRFRVGPGDLFIVDNTRVLHAREAYSGTGHRWLQGCYADKDSLLSTLAVLERAG